MNLRGEVTTDWADGVYTFRLTVPGALELEQKCDAAIAVIATRLNSGVYKVADLRETIRLGLIGGGTKPDVAFRLVKTYVDDRPLAESVPVARLIMGGLMFGFQDAPLAQGAGTESRNGSTPPTSTERPLSSVLEDISDLLASGNGPPS